MGEFLEKSAIIIMNDHRGRESELKVPLSASFFLLHSKLATFLCIAACGTHSHTVSIVMCVQERISLNLHQARFFCELPCRMSLRVGYILIQKKGWKERFAISIGRGKSLEENEVGG